MEMEALIYLLINVVVLWLVWMDATRRGAIRWLATLMVTIVPWPVGVFAYVYARPKRLGPGSATPD